MQTTAVFAFLAACGGSSPTTPTLDAPADPTGTTISGTLGSLGPVQKTVSSFVISNSGETLIYLGSDTLTCDELTVSRWLGMTKAGTQVVELVFKGDPKVGDIQVPPGEVNFAPGGMSSAHETGADSGVISLTTAEVHGNVAGTFDATYGSDSIAGTFHATFCANGQGY